MRTSTMRSGLTLILLFFAALAFAETNEGGGVRNGLNPVQVDHIIALTQSNFWGNAKGLDGKPFIPADDAEKARPLIPRADATRIVGEAHKYGLALWCGLEWKTTYLRYMQVERSRGWNEKQIGFVGMLFGVTQGQVFRLMGDRQCVP